MNRLIAIMSALPFLCMTACSGSFFQSKVAPPTIYVLSPGAVPADAGAAAARRGSAAATLTVSPAIAARMRRRSGR